MPKNAVIIEACRQAFTGYERNDRSLLVALLAEDAVFEFPKSLPYGGIYKGVKEFQAFWADLFENYYESFNYDLHDVLDAGTHVIIPVTARAKAKNGRTMENEHCFLFKVQDDRIVYGRIYADTAKGRDILKGMKIYPSRASE